MKVAEWMHLSASQSQLVGTHLMQCFGATSIMLWYNVATAVSVATRLQPRALSWSIPCSSNFRGKYFTSLTKDCIVKRCSA